MSLSSVLLSPLQPCSRHCRPRQPGEGQQAVVRQQPLVRVQGVMVLLKQSRLRPCWMLTWLWSRSTHHRRGECCWEVGFPVRRCHGSYLLWVDGKWGGQSIVGLATAILSAHGVVVFAAVCLTAADVTGCQASPVCYRCPMVRYSLAVLTAVCATGSRHGQSALTLWLGLCGLTTLASWTTPPTSCR